MRSAGRSGQGPAGRRGFATSTVLGLVAVIALLSTGALHDALFARQLATSRLLHQRAAALADIGIADAIARIAALAAPGGQNYVLHPQPAQADSVNVELRHAGTAPTPPGFSIGQFEVHWFEIESTGHTARGIRMTQAQGVARVMPARTVPPQGTLP
jgi:Tfp pilus assembly protein PilX